MELTQIIRGLRKNPLFSLAVIATIALAVGANAAIFSVVESALIRPLPFHEPDALVQIWKTRPDGRVSEQAWPDIEYYRSRARSLSGVAGYHGARVTLARGEAATVLSAAKVTANFFDVLGVRPVLGRAFREGEDRPGAAPLAIISHALWLREFAGDAAVIGRSVQLDGQSFEVVGVLPPEFHFAASNSADLYLPIDRPMSPWRESRTMHWLKGVGRLAPGATPQSARAEISSLMREMEREFGSNRGRDAEVRLLRDDLLGPVRPLLVMLYAAAAFVLLVACANITNLLLMRGAARQEELSVRAALGASQWRIARQLLVESAVLSLLGGALGLFVGQAALSALVAAIPEQQRLLLPWLASAGIDAGVFAYAMLISLVAGAGAGMLPALRGAKAGPGEVLRQSSRGMVGSSRLRHGLVAAELALTVALVSCAALFATSLSRLLALDPGVRTEGIVTMQVPLPRWQYTDDAAQRSFYRQLEQRLAVLPGVQQVGFVSKLPLEPGNSNSFTVPGAPPPVPGQEPTAMWRVVSTEYFGTLGIPLLAGRTFGAADDSASAPVIIINRAMAREAFGDADPIGRTVMMSGTEMRIVGVVGDVTIDRIEDRVPATVYTPWMQDMDVSMRLAVRTSGDPMVMVPAIRAAVRQIDAGVGLFNVATMEARIGSSQSVFLRRYPLLLVGAFAVLALLLALVGTYAVLSYSVAQRSREMGIRLALGAQPKAVRAMILGQAGRVAIVGLGAGVLLAWAAARAASSLFYGVQGREPLVLGAVVVALAACTLLAALVPALRAARTDPLISIRNQ